MFWNLFSKKEKKEKEEKKEMITVFDENIEDNVMIEKQKWIDSFLIPKLEEHKNNSEYLYNLLLVALSYNIYNEILEYALYLRGIDYTSKRSTEILLEIYFKSCAYDEVIFIVDNYIKENREMTDMIYYYYAMSLLFSNLENEYEETIFKGLSEFPNSNKLIKELKNNILINRNEKQIELIMEQFSKIDNSYKLNVLFSDIKFSNGDYKKGNEYILNAIKYSNNKFYKLNEISKILFKYKQYIEFENHILTKYYAKYSENEFTFLVLEFYKLMFRYNEGLDLLAELFNDSENKFKIEELEKLSSYEEEYLNIKYREEKRGEYESIINDDKIGDISFFNVAHPLYYYILNRNEKLLIEKKQDDAVMFLGLSFDKINKETNKKIIKYINSIHLYLLENIYRYTDYKFQISYMRDDLYIKYNKKEYDINYFRAIYKQNNSLKYIISGNVKEESLNRYFIEFYRYECEKDQIIKIVIPSLLNNNEDEITNKYINSIIEYFDINISINKFDLKTQINFSDILELLFDFDKYNRFRKWKMKYLLEYFINSKLKIENILISLSIIALMKIYKTRISNEYKNKLYDANVKLGNDENVNNIINEIFELKEIKNEK